MYLLGVAAERAPLIPSSQMAEQLGSGWGLLGHLFDPSLEIETASRALFLLGAATEQSDQSPEEILERLHDPYWAVGLGGKAVVLLVAASLRPTVAIDAGTFLGGSAAALSMFAERVITIDVDAARGDMSRDWRMSRSSAESQPTCSRSSCRPSVQRNWSCWTLRTTLMGSWLRWSSSSTPTRSP